MSDSQIPKNGESSGPSTAPGEGPEEALLKPLDVDGVAAVISGTALFVIGLVVLFLFRGTLAAHDASWWLWVCVAGAAMGLLGILYATRRRAVYQAAGRLTQ